MNPGFSFKYFTVVQDRTALKVGTDSMLLGALLKAQNPIRCLDLGSGSGVLALMACQQFSNANIDAIEIDTSSFKDCVHNFEHSPWSNRLNAIHGDYLSFGFSGKYDLIFSNPPFYLEASSQAKDFNIRSKHTTRDEFLNFMLCANNLLSKDGVLWLILPYRHLDLIMNYAKKHEMFLNSLITINAKVSIPKSRIVLCLSKNKSLLNQQTITVRNEDNSYTDTYINLTREFHSKELKK